MLKLVHLLGVVIGLGGALYCDFIILRSAVMKTIRPHTCSQIHLVSKFVLVGLLLLWLSGIAITAMILETNPGFWNNEKFWAKVAIVGVLTLNGLIIHRFVLRWIDEKRGERLFENVSPVKIFLMSAFGAISFGSWVMPLVLGSAPELSYAFPFSVFITHYVLLLALLFVMISSIGMVSESHAKANTLYIR